MKKYSHIVCIGDSFTNETEHYRREGLLDVFKEINYEFKSYPELLAEYYECDYTLFGEPGMTMTFTIQEFIKNINWFLTLENPLVLYQFGYFSNATIKLSNGIDLAWKDLYQEDRFDRNNFDEKSKYIVNKKSEFVSTMPIEDKLAITTWFEKFEAYRNYYNIDLFLTLTNHIKEIKNIDVFGFFVIEPDFQIPKHKNLLHLFNRGNALDGMDGREDGINYYLESLGIQDGHKSTSGNKKIANEIIKKIEKTSII